jgi:hypothetical protein
MDTGTVEEVIPVNRTAVLFLLLKLAAVLVVVNWLPIRKPDNPWVVPSLLVPFFVYMLWPSIRALGTGVAVELTDRGIVNYTGGVTFVSWHELEDLRIRSSWGTKQVELVLRNPEVVLNRVGGLRGWSLRKYVQKYGGQPSINASLAEGGADAVLATIQEKLGVRGHAV